MRKRGTVDTVSQRLAVTTPELQTMLGCGKDTAVKIGLEARARINIGNKALWNVSIIQEYLNQRSCGEKNAKRVELSKKTRKTVKGE